MQVQVSNNLSATIDFDEWAELARQDPVGFEQRRLALIEDFLNQFPNSDQRRLRGLQFRIDMERRRARTPLAACIRISAMMWDSLLGEDGLKEALDNFCTLTTEHLRKTANPSTSTARILPFRRFSR